MAMQAALTPFDGDYSKWSAHDKALETWFFGTEYKNKKIRPDGSGIGVGEVFLMGKLSSAPAPGDDFAHWTVGQLIAQHKIDRPGTMTDEWEQALDEYETEVFSNQTKADTQQVLNRILKDIRPFFDPQLPELSMIDYSDPFCCIRFLQRINNNYLRYVADHRATFINRVTDLARHGWKGNGTSREFTVHLQTLTRHIAELPQTIRPTHQMAITIDNVIASLTSDKRLSGVHSRLRSDNNRQPMNDFSDILREVTSVLEDYEEAEKDSEPAGSSREDPVASMASCNYAKTTKRNKYPPRTQQSSRSPISKPKHNELFLRVEEDIWKGYSQEQKSKINEARRIVMGTSGKRGRPNKAKFNQQQTKKATAEADIAELPREVDCFLSDLSETGMPKESPEPTMLFTTIAEGPCEESNKESPEPNDLFTTGTTKEGSPAVESSPNGSMSPDSGPSTNKPASSKMPWILLFIFSCCTSCFESTINFGKYIGNAIMSLCKQWWTAAFGICMSFNSDPQQNAKSAATCTMAQYLLALIIALIIMLVATVLLGGGVETTNAATRQVNASNSLLSGTHVSPFMSYQAAESMLEYKNGSWLFSYEISELKALAVTLPSADRDIELDWILDSGASCHFCNDSSKFISMKKCNISISTAKKGENLQAIGIGDCMITTQTATGEKVKLICKDALYVPEARRNLLSASKLGKDHFQVVLLSQDPVFPPGIYNCRKDKTSVEHSIPIIAIGTLFHVQTCADEEIRRSDRIENKWVCWHKRLGYMPLETLKNMIGSCQGLEDLQGVAMPRNYVSANVRMGKATNTDQPQQNPIRAKKPMEVVHCDLFGPCKQPSFAGHTYCCVFVDDCTRYTWVYTMKQKTEFFDILKKFYADTAIIRNQHRFCCLRRDNAGENMSSAVKNWLLEQGIKSENSTAHEPWQNGRAEVQIRVLCNIARTNMIASGLTGKFWARAIFYAADISNIQYRADLKMSPHQAIFGVKPDVSKCQPFGVECWLYVRADQRKDRKFDARGEPAIYCGRSTMDNKSSYVLYVPSRSSSTFVCTNNVVFGNKCPRAKDTPDVIDDGEIALDFPLEANDSEINSASVNVIMDQNDTHYILQMTDSSVKSVNKSRFISTFIRTENNNWTMKGAQIMNHVLQLDELSPLKPSSFFDAESVHFTDSSKYVDPKDYADAMSRSDSKQWQEAFDKEMNGLAQRNVFKVVDRPTDRNPLGTTMVWKYKIDNVNNTITRKCRLCLRGDWQKEGVDFFKDKTFSAVLNSRENRILYALAAANNWYMFSSDITQAFTYGELDVSLFCYPPAGYSCPTGKVLELNKCLYGAKQAPARFKAVLTAFMIAEGFRAVNDAQTVWIKTERNSVLINAIFVDDVHHCTNDLVMYRAFRKKFEKKFDLKADDHIDVYLGNQIIHDREKGTVTVSQQHYVMACLEKFGLAQCNGTDTPMTERLSTTDQPSTIDLKNQEQYRGMVGSLLYLASWTRIDIALAVSELSRFVSNPGEVHIEAAKRVFRYLKKTMHLGLTYRSSTSFPGQPDMPPNTLWGYVDSDWAGCPDTRKSTSAYVFMLNGAAISWRSKRQTTVALSTAEAEYISASAMVQEVIYLRKFLENLGFPQKEPTPVFADNETCIKWSEGSVGGSERAKHVDLRIHFVHEAVTAKHLKLNKVDSKLNGADILTKPPKDKNLFLELRHRLMGY